MNIVVLIIYILNFYVSIIYCESKSPESKFEDVLKSFYEHKVEKRRIEETHLKAEEVITKHNYSCETYTVKTKDGYILTVHRIPRAKGCHRRSKRDAPRPPVFLMHGVMASTTNWITNGPQSLAFLLADNGYDVWMGNARGNPYSRNHQNLLPSNMRFWDFSFHEIGNYDLPAIIDFILDQTGFPNLFYVGHSQGSTVLLILLSLLPVYNNRVAAAFLLSPVAYMSHMTSPLLILWSLASNPIGFIFDLIGYGEFWPSSDTMRTIARFLCKDGDFTKIICDLPLFLITGLNPANVLPESIAIYVANAGSVASRQLIHYGQLYNSGEFRPFSFGLPENLIRYHSLQPPNYPLGNIRIPLFMFNSPNDWLANPIDVARLHREVPTSIVIDLPDPTISHLDYIIGINAPELIYFPILWRLNNLTLSPPALGPPDLRSPSFPNITQPSPIGPSRFPPVNPPRFPPVNPPRYPPVNPPRFPPVDPPRYPPIDRPNPPSVNFPRPIQIGPSRFPPVNPRFSPNYPSRYPPE